MDADSNVPGPREDAPAPQLNQLATLAYATPAPRPGSPVAAGVWITLAGLALIFLGGCFLIGVMICSFNNYSSGMAFVALLYALAFLCFTAAGCILFLGIRKLLAVGRPS